MKNKTLIITAAGLVITTIAIFAFVQYNANKERCSRVSNGLANGSVNC